MAAVTATPWEFDAAELPGLWPQARDGLIVGLLPEPLDPDSAGQGMSLCDHLAVDADVMVGASIGVAQLGTVGLVLVYRQYTPLMAARVAWEVGCRLRRERLAAGESPRVVMTGSYPSPDMVPDGVTFVRYRVRVRDCEVISLISVWEVRFPALVDSAGESSAVL